MLNIKTSKQDWSLFRRKLPLWQEAYMDRLNQEYVALLSENNSPSEKFWTLYERICQDKRKRGVILQLRQDNMLLDLAALISEGAINFQDLEEFSDDVKEAVHYLCNGD